MKRLITLTQADIEPGYSGEKPEHYRERRAVRAVLKDDRGRVALLHVTKKAYYKLPGGGVEEGENVEIALERELLEEVGAKADVVAELGRVEEWRDYADYGLHQISDAYLAVVNGEVGEPCFTVEELAGGFEVVWADDISHAIKLVQTAENHPDDKTRFMCQRELAILQAANKNRND